MSYHHYPRRLRCWAHLLRRAWGLVQSCDRAARAFEKAAAREGLRPFFVNLARAYREMGLPEAAGEALRKAGETS